MNFFLYSIKIKIGIAFRLYFLYPYKYSSSIFRSIVPKKVLQSKSSTIQSNIIFHNWKDNYLFGDYIFIGSNTFIDNCSKIGSFSCISMNVKIGLENHNLKTISTSPFFYKKNKGWVLNNNTLESNIVVIDEDVLISSNAIILNGVKLGVGCVIGAGAVVDKDVPPYAIVGGVPAKIIRYRFSDEIIKLLIESKWWNLNVDVLKSMHEYFDNPQLFLQNIDQFKK